MQPSEIWKNQDDIYIEIEVSTGTLYSQLLLENAKKCTDSRDSDCAEGYSLVASGDGQRWCYSIIWTVPLIQGINFDVNSNELCVG